MDKLKGEVDKGLKDAATSLSVVAAMAQLEKLVKEFKGFCHK